MKIEIPEAFIDTVDLFYLDPDFLVGGLMAIHKDNSDIVLTVRLPQDGWTRWWIRKIEDGVVTLDSEDMYEEAGRQI